MSTARRIHRPVVACALACGVLASTSGVAAGEAWPSYRTADVTAAELAGRLAHERTADITPAELAGKLIPNQAAARTVGAPAPATHSAAPRVDSTGTGFDWGSAGIGAAVTGGFALVAAGGFGAAYRARVRLAR